jgi:hypothetical protein
MTGPVIKIDDSARMLIPDQPLPPLRRARWRTVPPDAIGPTGWARTERERCTNVNDNDRRCMLREAHDGAHAWRSLGGLRIFEWE